MLRWALHAMKKFGFMHFAMRNRSPENTFAAAEKPFTHVARP
jgi:hypothetical protein